MAHDGSLASQVEQWIVDALLECRDFSDGAVEPFPGSSRPDGQQLIDEMIAHRSPYVAVLFEGDRPIPLQEGEYAYEPTYGIYVAVHNQRPAVARKGDAATAGTNLLRDVMRATLHNQYPTCAGEGYATDHTEFRGVRVVFQRADAFVMRGELVVRESPTSEG